MVNIFIYVNFCQIQIIYVWSSIHSEMDSKRTLLQTFSTYQDDTCFYSKPEYPKHKGAKWSVLICVLFSHRKMHRNGSMAR